MFLNLIEQGNSVREFILPTLIATSMSHVEIKQEACLNMFLTQ